MQTRISPEQIETYRRDGYVVIAGFLATAELAEIANAVEESVKQIGRQRVAGNVDLAEPENYRHTVIMQRLNLWKINGVVKKYVLHPGLGRMLCELAGIGGVRIWHDQT